MIVRGVMGPRNDDIVNQEHHNILISFAERDVDLQTDGGGRLGLGLPS